MSQLEGNGSGGEEFYSPLSSPTLRRKSVTGEEETICDDESMDTGGQDTTVFSTPQPGSTATGGTTSTETLPYSTDSEGATGGTETTPAPPTKRQVGRRTGGKPSGAGAGSSQPSDEEEVPALTSDEEDDE